MGNAADYAQRTFLDIVIVLSGGGGSGHERDSVDSFEGTRNVG